MTQFHRINKDFFIQGGNIENKENNSIKSEYFKDENINLPHDLPGKIGMTRYKNQKNTNGTQFYITLQELPEFNGKFVVVGQIIQGMKFLKKINKIQNKNDQTPCFNIQIIDSGIYEFDCLDFGFKKENLGEQKKQQIDDIMNMSQSSLDMKQRLHSKQFNRYSSEYQDKVGNLDEKQLQKYSQKILDIAQRSSALEIELSDNNIEVSLTCSQIEKNL
ncbi:Cyclophilin-like peptidyl-prolyl cis-trans isomerase domain [Pseudocohnilembus persalinus]|uniref:Peptidyl-prolyl cis-trans isomerase n=1 Tax=Pseudocohnilembus persalinus TaxID=266149 RepID=A0A0V0R9M0_PSEPJ|nr:Cyclophilin-like peptidyl-prolyl cis-trans isomerase domain [Pseudocohnilembus persalinus]|eukprot:KRX11166.1 Cyclophilin-like peptidyl-prolyl cis-trans isomerase domain [Pseudocohnilembus persalinus]